ncbi:MAG: hypothetical protein H6Q04_2445 [Acidobacteria bacterium]|nr:hypothetical protein [Acidobacteriota bacterium]
MNFIAVAVLSGCFNNGESNPELGIRHPRIACVMRLQKNG